MSLLTQASICITPNGYKEGTLYSVIPSDGSGDMSVVRATTATRVNSAGLVELVPYNLLTYSQDFSSNWALNQATKTSGQADPFGGTKAIKLKYNTSVNYHSITQGISLTGPNANSVYAKAGELQFLQIASAQSIEEYANFNLNTGVVGTNGTLASNVQIENVGNGWYRCSVVFTNGSNGIYCAIASSASMQWLGVDTFAGANATDGLYLYGAQLNAGSLLPYQKTETRLNIPRLDYSNGTCPSLLVEPQRTNELLYSSSFDNVLWLKLNASVTANSVTSPSGIQDADTLIENTANDEHAIYRAITGTSKTLSFYAKPNGRNWVSVLSNNGDYSFFNIANGPLGTIAATSTATIEDAGNGWYRCTVYNTHPTFGAVINLATANGTTVYTGNGTSGVYIWGAQLEAATYPTSYIPTTSASVTRNADSVSKTGISSLIGQQEGTVFFDGVINGCENIFANLINTERNTTASFGISYTKASSQISAFVYYGGIGFVLSAYGIAIGQRAKIAFAYKSGNTTLYVNGVQAVTDTTTFTFPASLDDIFIGDPVTYFAYQESITNNATALFKTRLANSELQSLTTI